MLHREITDAMLADTRRALEDDGCAVIPGFLAPSLDAIRRETRSLAPKAYVKKRFGNPYSSTDDESLPKNHPVRHFMERTNAFVAGDLIPEQTHLKQIYRSESFKSLVAGLVGLPEVYEYADPLAGLVINVLEPGWTHPWHFDTNEFIVSTLTQEADEGGVFEYCPQIRTPESECFDDVGRVLRGEDRSKVKKLHLKPGDIQIFYGRYSLHRVTPPTGPTPRHTAIFAYAKAPGMIGKPERTKHLFGRVTPEHIAAAEARSDELLD